MTAIDPVNGGMYYFSWDEPGDSTDFTVSFSRTTSMDIRVPDIGDPGDEFTLLIDGNEVAWTTIGYEGGLFVGALKDYVFSEGDHVITVVTAAAAPGGGGTMIEFEDLDPLVVVGPDSAATTENAAVVFDVLENDATSLPGGSLSFVSVAVESGLGSATVFNDDEIRFDPGAAYDYLAAGETATVEIAYRVSDGVIGSATGIATVTVTGENDGPVANTDAFAATEGVASANLWAALLGNDSDADLSDVLSITAVNTGATLGTVDFDPAAQSLVYHPNALYFETLAPGTEVTDSFSYTVTDSVGATSTATVTVTVTIAFSGITVTLGDGADNYVGTPDEDHINGAGGNDVLDGLGDDDLLQGGAGSDVLIGGVGGDTLDGGDGRDIASYRTAMRGVSAFLGNRLFNTGDAAGDSYAGIENLEGSAFDDVLGGNADANDFFGGDGTDMVSYAHAASGVVASLTNSAMSPSPMVSQTGEAAGDRYHSIEVLQGSNFGDTLFAAATGSALFGLDGDDRLYGQGGDDVLVGDAGQDLLIGDGGSDRLYGYDGDDTLRGDAGADFLWGVTGDDVLNGGAGNDMLDGGAGNDSYTGGAGADLFMVRDLGDTDTIADFKRAQGDKIDLRSLGIDEWIGTQAFHSDAGEVRIRNAGADWWLEGDTNGDGIADFSVALGHVQLIQTDVIM